VEPVVVQPGMTEVQLGRHLEFLEDEQGRWSLEDIRRPENARRFTPSERDVPSFGFSTAPIWFHFELRGQVRHRQRMLLEIAFPMLDRVEVYVERPEGGFDREVVGDHFPHGNKVISHSSFLFPLEVNPGQRRQVYLRVQTEGALQLPLTLWTPQGFWDHEQRTRIAYGFYYGFMIIMIIYNLFLFVATRYRSYLLFVFYALSLLVYLATNDGLVQEVLLPAFPWWANRIVPISLGTAVGVGGLMTLELFNLKGIMPGWHRVLFWMSVVGLASAVGALFIPYNAVTRFAAFWVAPGTTMILIVSVLTWRRGQQIARYYILAWSIMVLGTVLASFSRLGLIPRTQLTDFSWVIGLALNVVFISIALADRINPLKREREQVQTELREAYEQLAEHDRIKSNFFANVSHELRTPLTLILTPLEQLLGGLAGDLPESVTERLRLMEGNTQRLLRLVNQLLDFSRLESGAMAVSYERVDARALVAAITEAFQPYARSKEISLSLRGEQDLPSLYTDPVKLEKIIGNLLSNACKFTDSSGQVVCRLSADEASLEIAVIDTGIGIGRQDLPKLFERFSQIDDSSTRRYEGTGIGLALSRELVALMGGELTVQS
jgi:signal transduction histidine kinase